MSPSPRVVLVGTMGAGKTTVGRLIADQQGWSFLDTEVIGQLCHLCQVGDNGDFILLAESDKPMSSPGYDHLGILLDTREEVDEKLARCKAWQAKDDRVQIKEYKDLVTPNLTVHAFYVKYLLPIWFDVQCFERPD